jgi:glycerol-3-phosphate O-acyltransferase
VRPAGARLPLALLPGRHAIALGRHRAAAQARLVGSADRGVRAHADRGRSGAIYFVPATINYLITLEAETLIADYLSEAGKGRFIIEDDESTRFDPLFAFTRKLLGMRGAVVIRFGDPIDPFGNAVDDKGMSHDRRGRKVDPASYVKNRTGAVTLDAARDAQYTRELGEAICRRTRGTP